MSLADLDSLCDDLLRQLRAIDQTKPWTTPIGGGVGAGVMEQLWLIEEQARELGVGGRPRPQVTLDWGWMGTAESVAQATAWVEELRRRVDGPEADQPRASLANNILRLTGKVWHASYKTGETVEVGDFPDRQGSVLNHLARLLAEPNRRFGALEFYPPPPGAVPLPHLGRDESSDDQALKEVEKKLTELAQEIKEAVNYSDTDEADRLRKEFNALSKHLEGEQGARKRGHKKRCGTLSPAEKADQNLRVGLSKLTERFRKVGLPKLADHLDKYLDNSGGEWWYAPPPDTSPWHVTRPNPRPER